MGRPGNVLHITVIFGSVVFVGNLQSNGSPQCYTVFRSRQDGDLIGFLAICGQGALARASPVKLYLYVFLC